MAGYSIYLLRNAYIESKNADNFAKYSENSIYRFCVYLTRLCCEQNRGHTFSKIKDFETTEKNDFVIQSPTKEVTDNCKESPKIGEVILYMILLFCFLIISGIGWNANYSFFKEATSKVIII